MKFEAFSFKKLAIGSLLASSLFAAVSLAGPMLICHPFDIGSAKSLPWVSHSWNLNGSETYDTKKLATDTVAILDTDSTVLVHMETLRRATLFARQDPQAAKELLTRLVARADSASGDSRAHAIFDAGYLVEAYKQWMIKEQLSLVKGLDGYAMVKKALELGGNDPQMEFAAALISLGGPVNEQSAHAQKAVAGAKSDALLERNLFSHFGGPETHTMAEIINQNQSKAARN